MTKIIDPNIDGLLRSRSPEPQMPVQMVMPLSHPQLIALMAAHLASFKPNPAHAVKLAIDLFAETVVQIGETGHGLRDAIGKANARHGPPPS